jgi:hypothetical protein
MLRRLMFPIASFALVCFAATYSAPASEAQELPGGDRPCGTEKKICTGNPEECDTTPHFFICWGNTGNCDDEGCV